MGFLQKGTEEGSGANADTSGIDSAGKAIDKAVEKISKEFVPDKADKFTPGIEDDDDWWKEGLIEISFTVEGSQQLSSTGSTKKAKTDWKVTAGPVKKRSDKPPKGKTKTFKPGDPVPDLCSGLFEDHGELTTDFQEGFAKAQSVNKAIDAVKDNIKNYPGRTLQDRTCPAACPDQRATLYVQLKEVGSSIGKVRNKVKWWLRIYCFEEAGEK